MRPRYRDRRGAKRVLGKHGSRARPSGSLDHHQIAAVGIFDSGTSGAKADTGDSKRLHLFPALAQLAVAMLVFLPGTAGTELITTDLAALAHEGGMLLGLIASIVIGTFPFPRLVRGQG